LTDYLNIGLQEFEIMARKAPSRAGTPSASSTTATTSGAAGPSSSSAPASNIRNTNNVQQIVQHVWNNYVQKTPQRMKLIDAFMAFLIVVGGLQFVYCVIGGNYVCRQILGLLNGCIGLR
jgi:oligosaccharyltransferase complex subunit epsilon